MLHIAGSGILLARLSNDLPIHLAGAEHDGYITSACGLVKVPSEEWAFRTADDPIDETEVCGLCLRGEPSEEHTAW